MHKCDPYEQSISPACHSLSLRACRHSTIRVYQDIPIAPAGLQVDCSCYKDDLFHFDCCELPFTVKPPKVRYRLRRAYLTHPLTTASASNPLSFTACATLSCFQWSSPSISLTGMRTDNILLTYHTSDLKSNERRRRRAVHLAVRTPI